MNHATADSIADILRNYRFRTGTEKALQEGVDAALKLAGVEFDREFRIDRGAIDFRTKCGVGIECKISGAFPEVARQLLRYAENGSIREILLVSSRSKHSAIPETLQGKPSRFLWVRSQI